MSGTTLFTNLQSVTHDESEGLQTTLTPPTATEDNNDNDVSLASVSTIVSALSTKIIALGVTSVAAIGAAQNQVADFVAGKEVQNLGFKLTGGVTELATTIGASAGGTITLKRIDATTILGMVLGSDPNSGADDRVAFALVLETTGTGAKVTIVQYEALTHGNAAQTDEALTLAGYVEIGAQADVGFSDFSTAAAGQNYWNIIQAPAGSTTQLLVTGTDLGIDTVNTNATSLGSNQQSIVQGEGLVFDFVKGFAETATTDYRDLNTINYTDRVEGPGGGFKIMQTGGSSGTRVDATVRAFNSSETASDFADGTLSTTGEQEISTVKVFLGTTKVAEWVRTTGEVNGLPDSAGMSFSTSGSGVKISGLLVNYRVEFNAGGYIDRFSVTNSSGAGSTRKFDLGDIRLGGTVTDSVAIGDNIRFEDDAPTAIGTQQTGSVNENDLPAGTDSTKETLVATGDLDSLVNLGRDGGTYEIKALPADPAELPASLKGLKSGGVDITYELTSNILTAKAGTVEVFTLAINATTGVWTFTLKAPLDHASGDGTNSIQIDFSGLLAAKDKDNDPVAFEAGDLVVTVVDDVPVASAATSTDTVDEDDLTDGTDADKEDLIASGDLSTLINFGGDGEKSFVLKASTASLTAQALTSHGTGLTYEVVDDTITAKAGLREVFTLKVESNGAWTFTLIDQLDHASGDGQNDEVIDFSGMVEAKDFDNDPVDLGANSFKVTVVDDVPVLVGAATQAGTVDEDDLADGTDPAPKDALTTTGDLSALVNFGADEEASFAIKASTASLTAQALTSNGTGLTYEVVGDTVTAKAGLRDVFTLKVESDGAWTFTLMDQLDHASGDGQNDKVIDFSGMVEAKDFDNDPISLGANSFKVTVVDDVPVLVGAATQAGTVDEDDLADGTDTSKEDLFVSGDLSALVNFGADQEASFAIKASTASLTAQALTSNGTGLSYTVVGDTITAKAGLRDVFTLKVESDGDWTFTLKDQFDHASGDGQNSLVIDFSGMVQAKDFDNDPVDLGADSFKVTVVDDVPVLVGAATQTGTVDEDDLADGTDTSKEALTATGDLSSLVNFGADQDKSFAFKASTASLTAQALTSAGTALAYAISGTTLTASADDDGAGGNPARTVFTLSLGTNGSWTFTLADQLDHLGGNADSLAIDFSGMVEAKDFDNDPIDLGANSFKVTVVDDAPLNIAPAAALVPTTAGSKSFDLDGGIVGSVLPKIGADMAGTVKFNVVDGSVLSGKVGGSITSAPLTYLGQTIKVYLNADGTMLTARAVGADLNSAADDIDVFKITLSPTAGTYSVQVLNAIDNNAIGFADFGSSGAGLRYWLGVAGSPAAKDLLVTGGNPGVTSVNNDSDDIGANNQWIDPKQNASGQNEFLRLDFVNGITTTGGTGSLGDIPVGQHYLVNDVGFTIMEGKGEAKGVNVLIRAIDATRDINGGDGTSIAADLQAGSLDVITTVRLKDGSSNWVTYNLSGGTSQAGGRITFNADGSVTVKDVNAPSTALRDKIAVSTQTGFDRLEIENVDTRKTDAFSIGGFSVGGDKGGTIETSFDLQLSDYDGDTASGTIALTLSPDAVW
jgi:T1SS-143 domain-containing protein